MLSQVLLAYEEVQKGTDIAKIVEMIEERKGNNEICFIPENLTALKNGGRISPAVAAIGNVIGLKPVLLLKDGELAKDGMTRHIKNALLDFVNSKLADFPTSEYDYQIASFDANEKIYASLKNHLQEILGDYEMTEGLLPINVCAHCGPGTIGIVVFPKINGQSISKFL